MIIDNDDWIMWKENGEGKFRGNNRENFKIKKKFSPKRSVLFIYLNFCFLKFDNQFCCYCCEGVSGVRAMGVVSNRTRGVDVSIKAVGFV